MNTFFCCNFESFFILGMNRFISNIEEKITEMKLYIYSLAKLLNLFQFPEYFTNNKQTFTLLPFLVCWVLLLEKLSPKYCRIKWKGHFKLFKSVICCNFWDIESSFIFRPQRRVCMGPFMRPFARNYSPTTIFFVKHSPSTIALSETRIFEEKFQVRFLIWNFKLSKRILSWIFKWIFLRLP